MKNKSQRIEYLDVAKGISIICVVLGHLGIMQKYIYMFHMPAFFFISGMLSKTYADKREFIKRKAVSLLVPYIVFLFIVYFFQQLDYFNTVAITGKELALSILHAILGGRWLSSYTTVFWFITCLFFVQILFNYIIQKFSFLQVIYIMLFFVVIAYYNAAYFQNIKFPWNINVVLIASPFYFVGSCFRKFRLPNYCNLLNGIVLILGLELTALGYGNYFDMKNVFYGIPILTLLISISAIMVVLYISKKISNFWVARLILVEVGAASSVIMYLHQLIQISANKHLTHNLITIVILSLSLPYLAYRFLKSYSLTRALFLGSNKDFNKILAKFKNNNPQPI